MENLSGKFAVQKGRLLKMFFFANALEQNISSKSLRCSSFSMIVVVGIFSENIAGIFWEYETFSHI